MPIPITDRACAVIVAHNHPSGRLEPESGRSRNHMLAQGSRGYPRYRASRSCHLFWHGLLSFVEHGLLEPPNPD